MWAEDGGWNNDHVEKMLCLRPCSHYTIFQFSDTLGRSHYAIFRSIGCFSLQDSSEMEAFTLRDSLHPEAQLPARPVVFNWNTRRWDYSNICTPISAVFSIFFWITWTAVCSEQLFSFLDQWWSEGCVDWDCKHLEYRVHSSICCRFSPLLLFASLICGNAHVCIHWL